MKVTLSEARSILTPQRGGFLAGGPYPFTHALSAYTGCAFGNTTCGMYCYAQFLPNWTSKHASLPWGGAVSVKTNAPDLLERALASMKAGTRQALRIFMSSATDPYQPLESKHGITRRCLEVFARYPDLDLLVIQTRSPLAARDLDVMGQIPYAWLSLTIETDDQAYLNSLKGGPSLEKRWALVRAAREAKVSTQITVSPCLLYSGVESFGQRLLESGAHRVIVDTTVDGDGADGERTARTSFAQIEPSWKETTPAHQLYNYLREHASAFDISLGWSNAGFCGIEPRQHAKKIGKC
jgi:DNA repair photolyase